MSCEPEPAAKASISPEPPRPAEALATAEESAAIAFVRGELSAQLSTCKCASFPEVCGDWNLLRFVRGADGDRALATARFKAMLAWRAANGADAMRERGEYSSTRPNISEFHSETRVLEYPFSTLFAIQNGTQGY